MIHFRITVEGFHEGHDTLTHAMPVLNDLAIMIDGPIRDWLGYQRDNPAKWGVKGAHKLPTARVPGEPEVIEVECAVVGFEQLPIEDRIESLEATIEEYQAGIERLRAVNPAMADIVTLESRRLGGC